MSLLGLSYNCSTNHDMGLTVGAPEEGFDITAVATTMEKMVDWVHANVSGDNCGEVFVSTTYSVVGEYINQMGNGDDVEVVAVVLETFVDGDEEITIPMCLIFNMDATLLT